MSCPSRPKWYTAEALAKCWGVDLDFVNLHNQTGQLKAEVLFTDSERNNQCWMPENYTEADWQQLRLEEMIHVGKYFKLEVVESFENENPDLIKNHVQEAFPRLVRNEVSLKGLKKIADYLGLTADYLKHCWKEKNYPINKEGRKLYAYPSQLDKWRASRNKK